MADRIFTVTDWGTVGPPSGWQFGAGSFTGVGNAELFGYHPSNGSLWVGKNTGSGFAFQHWGTVSPTGGWQFHVGDFTGDDRGRHCRVSLEQRHPVGRGESGRKLSAATVGLGATVLGVAIRRGLPHRRRQGRPVRLPPEQWQPLGRAQYRQRFRIPAVGHVAPTSVWQFVVADVTGSGRPDVVGYDPSNGSVWVGENSGNSFALQQRGVLQPPSGWQISAGYFAGRAKADVFAYHPSNGSVWVSIDNVTGYTFEQWGAAVPPEGWVVRSRIVHRRHLDRPHRLSVGHRKRCNCGVRRRARSKVIAGLCRPSPVNASPS